MLEVHETFFLNCPIFTQNLKHTGKTMNVYCTLSHGTNLVCANNPASRLLLNVLLR